jgi:hypothetical protein
VVVENVLFGLAEFDGEFHEVSSVTTIAIAQAVPRGIIFTKLPWKFPPS